VVTRENIDSEVVLTARLTAARSTDTSGFIIATLAVSASENSDFVPGPYPLTIPAGETEITILDDDRPRVSFAAGSSSVAESGGTQNVAVSISPAPTTAITVNYTVSGSATENTDFSITGSGTVTVAANATSVNIPVLITDDNGEEAAETVILTLSSGVGYNVGSTSSHILTIADNDTPGLVLSPPSLTVTEGGTGSYTAALATPPSAPVTVNVFSDNGEVTFAPASLSFTTSNWSTAQPVTVTAAQDADTANDNATLSHTATGGGYGSVTGEVAVIVTDDDTGNTLPVVTLSMDKTTALEGSSTDWARMTLTLNRILTAGQSVKAPLVFSGGGLGADFTLSRHRSSSGVTLDTATGVVTFTGSGEDERDGAMWMSVRLLAAADQDETNETVSVSIPTGTTGNPRLTAVNVDGALTGVGSGEILLFDQANLPRKPTGLTATPGNGKVILSWDDPENPDITEYQFRSRAAGDSYPAVWSLNRNVSLLHLNGISLVGLTNGAQYSFQVRAVAGSFRSEPAEVTATPLAPALLFSPAAVGLIEGGTGSYTVALAIPPSAPVTVTLASDSSEVTVDTDAGTEGDQNTLTFTASDWNTGKPVTVTAAQDDDTANDTATLSHTAAGGDYGSVTAEVAVTVTDDDAPGLALSPPSLTVAEGETGDYTVALSAPPSAPVTVDVVSDNDEVTVAPASLSFTVENWNTPQPVTVVTEQNNEMANDMATLTHTASGGGYGSVTGEVAVDVLDVANDLLFSQSLLTVMESQDVSYTVALSTQPSAPVTVDVVSDNGGVTVAPASLSFTIENWNTPQSVRVTAAQDNGMANHSAMLHHRATGDGYTGVSGAVQVQVEAAESRAVAAWHVRFGRTVAQQVVDAVQQRLTTPPPLSGLQVTVAGENLTATPLEENEGALSKLLGFEAVTTGQVAQDSAFSFSPPAPAEDGEGDTPQLSFWGAGALSSFHGQEDTLSLDGNVGTALLGADWRTQQWQAGAALSHSWGSGSYAGEDGNDAALTARLTGLFPYGRYALSPRLGVWAVAGYGWGTLSVKPDGSKREYQPGATMVMGAVGLDGLLIDGGDDGFSLSTTTDLLTVKTTTEQVDGLASSEGSVSRLRMGLEATRPVPLPNGASLLPSVEVGIRHDGGDAETGFGLEVGAALAWHDPQRGISAEVKGRSLVTHVEEEFREQGMALSFSWNPDPSNRGPSLAIGHTVGDAASGMDALLDPTVLEGGGAAAGSNSHQFTADFAYGFPIHNDRLTLTPAVAVALSPESRSYGLLWSLAPYSQQGRTQPWQLSLEGEREENTTADTPVDHSLMLNFSLLF